MDSSKFFALLFSCMFLVSSITPILGCGYCGEPTHKPKKGGSHHGKPIIKIPPVTVPPVTVPKLPVPPVTVPPVTVPKLPVPPVTVPPVTVPKLPVPPVTVPPVLNPPSGPSGKPCPPGTPVTPAQPTCPIDVLKLGACVDLLGGLIHIGLGDPAVNTCCPILKGLAEAEAALCLCTTLKVKLLNLNLYVPLALQVLLTCGKAPPPGFTCTI